jgi:nickel transport protein
MNRRIFAMALFQLVLLGVQSPLHGHTVNYEAQQKGMAVRVFYTAKDPASYSEFEVYGPGDTLPHQTGRTDKNGFVAFVPDRAGPWKLKVLGESAHGFHGVTIDVNVDQDLNLESFSKPLVATSTKLITGISLIIGVFGIYAFIKSRKKTAD